KAVVASDVDLKAENNRAESMIAIRQSTASAPTNFNATEGEGGVILTWSSPANATTEVTDDFESYDIWAYANIGQWTLVDGDKGMTGGFFKETYYPSQEKPFAYTVWAPKDYTGDGTFNITTENAALTPHSGDKALASIYSFTIPEGGSAADFIDNDDWLISPELPGMVQTVSFHATHYKANDGSAQYPQTYQVLYSKTDKETASFTAIDGDRKTAGDWEKVSVELPEGSKYFAIRHISNKDDAFIFLVDDVTYSVGGGEPASYNVYVDGGLYTNVKGSELTAAVSGLADGTHQFAVTAVYPDGKESRPVIVVLTTTGIDGISPDGKPVDIYTVDGQLVRKQATSLEGLKGLYVIDNRKVLVR
ncbi:MAG: choice-of-anchor J domain-containing protein, partial [Prevotellaceae bacterium]|nr:choice-of-anchor J domain-containing protein [Prevotella sp.]MDD7257474.1 choice-of-anchor J domain-containing protein [Prevotellaceae bacterium]MDY6129726.1 choice-of-anchor J domain-containing protein [Prevotella sp.]